MANKIARIQKNKEIQEREEFFKNSFKKKGNVVSDTYPSQISLKDLLTHDEFILSYNFLFLRDPKQWKCRIKSKKMEKRKIDLVRFLFQKYPVPKFS